MCTLNGKVNSIITPEDYRQARIMASKVNSEYHKGKTPWNKGLTKYTDERVYKNTINFIKAAKRYGKDNPMYGKGYLVEGNKNGMYGVHRFGKDNPMYGKHHSDETKAKLSKVRSKPIICIETGNIYPNAKIAAAKFNINRYKIDKCCKNPGDDSFTAAGYHWRYIKDEELV